MHPPSITAAYLAVFALLYAGLSLQVVRLRRKFRFAFGDGGNNELRNAIRAHSHFAEYVPIIALMVAMLEITGLPRIWGYTWRWEHFSLRGFSTHLACTPSHGPRNSRSAVQAV